MATLKYKENGVVKELIIPASGIKLLDLEGNFASKNLELAMKELGETTRVFVDDVDPSKDGLWFDTSDQLNTSDDNNVVQRIKDYINDETLPSTSTSTTSELNVLNVDNQKQIKFDIEGRTIYNVLGYDGNCEDVSKWSVSNGTLSLDTTNKVFGSNGIKLTANGVGLSQLYKNITSLLNNTKYYCASAYIKHGSGTQNKLQLWNGTSTIGSSSVLDTTKFIRTFIKLQPSDIGATTNNLGITLDSTNGSFGFVDGIMLEEITASQYADSSFTPSDYVDNETSVGDYTTVIKTRGKNMISLVQGSFGTNGQIARDVTRLTHKDGAMSVKPNTSYTFSLDKTLQYVFYEFDNEKNIIGSPSWQTATTNATFITGSNTRYLGVAFKIDNTTPIYAEDYKIQVEEGNVATAYECYQESSYEINQSLRSIDDTWKDEIKEGKLIRRIGKVVLDGTLPWLYGNTYTGYKYVYLLSGYLPPNMYINPDNVAETEIHKILNTKNKLLTNRTSFSTYGSQYECFNNNPTSLALTINNSDSGWGDSYTPTQAEIQAYFYGWKMYDAVANPNGSGVYNGTGSKTWCYIGANGALTGGTMTLPTTHATAYYNPYRMYYQLLTPQIEELTPSHLVANKGWNMLIECSGIQSWVRPKITYKILDTQKTNINELEKGLSHSRKKISYLIKDTKNISNPNLLINPAFQIYQRGSSFTSSPTGQYTADRWMIGSDTGATLTKSAKGVKINIVNVGTWTNFQQIFEDNSAQAFVGKTLTFSCKVSNPNNIAQTWSCGLTANGIPYYFAGGIQNIDYSNNIISTTFKVDKFVTKFQMGIQLKSNVAGVETEIEWAKLEMSDRPTPFIAPSIAEELTKCMRFYESIQFSFRPMVATTSGIAWDIPYKMFNKRIQPTIANLYFNDELSNNLTANLSTGVYSGNNINFWSQYVLTIGRNYTIKCTLDAEIY